MTKVLHTMRRFAKKYVIPHAENNFRPYLLRATGVFFVLGILFVSAFGSNLYRLALTASDFLAAVLPSVLVDLANGDRAQYSLSQLRINPILEEAARMKAEDMAAKGYFAHESPEGKTPWYWFLQAGYPIHYAGENLAINFDDSSAVNTAWMNSPTHRANILNTNFTEIGIAIARGVYEGRETTFVVQMFGRPANVPDRTAETEPVESVPEPETETLAATEALSPDVLSAEAESSPETAVAEEIPVDLSDDVRLEPLPESETLGAAAPETFVAVVNTNAEPMDETPTVAGAVWYTNAFERFVTSPTKLLGAFYILVAALVALSLMFVVVVRHERRLRHAFYALALIALIVGAFYSYQFYVESRVIVTSAPLPLATR